MSYPEYVNGEPPIITLSEYDDASWASTTCLDHRNNQYVVVVMENPDKTVAIINEKDYEVLDRIFKSAHETHSKQQAGK
ncbi:unnamed protein product [Candida verbasci]|uniref:Uncharacterized protein n=1 Tax=Candida verbasci TaxID=1227364 RepID=A0A9W4TVE7_9ASCO|nr:unnamed protein product [Candida verbasci]